MRMRSYLLYIERADIECSLSESGHYYFFSVNPRCLHVNQFTPQKKQQKRLVHINVVNSPCLHANEIISPLYRTGGHRVLSIRIRTLLFLFCKSTMSPCESDHISFILNSDWGNRPLSNIHEDNTLRSDLAPASAPVDHAFLRQLFTHMLPVVPQFLDLTCYIVRL